MEIITIALSLILIIFVLLTVKRYIIFSYIQSTENIFADKMDAAVFAMGVNGWQTIHILLSRDHR